jgi:hypothetical protein
MKKTIILFAFIIACLNTYAQFAQRQKIVIFTPLYLDSVFDATGNFKFEKNNFPKYVVPGLEFYQGVQTAIDSLERRGAPLEIFIYDSRGKESLSNQLNKPEIKNASLIIANTNAQETRFIADAALKNKTPFISASYPNDAGISNNPFFVILNSTLQTHVEKMYEFLQKYHSQDNLVYFTRPGAQENQLKSQFIEFSKVTTTKPVNIKFVELAKNFKATDLKKYLDSTKRNVCIAGSLDESFGLSLLKEFQALHHTYPLRVMGMPNWDRLNFSRIANIEIIYSSPFNYNRNTALETKLYEEYNSNFSSKPGELFFRGYETTLRFGLLLLDTKKDVASNLTRKGNTVFTSFDIQPVFKDVNTMALDYFENRNIYFIKNFGGMRTVVQ